MRELSAEARLHLYARSFSRRTGTGFHAAALYGAFAIIRAMSTREKRIQSSAMLTAALTMGAANLRAGGLGRSSGVFT